MADPITRTVHVEGVYARSVPDVDGLVTSGPGIFWRVASRNDKTGGPYFEVTLEAIDAHDVPFGPDAPNVWALPPILKVAD
jgi:hypothetical protein